MRGIRRVGRYATLLLRMQSQRRGESEKRRPQEFHDERAVTRTSDS